MFLYNDYYGITVGDYMLTHFFIKRLYIVGAWSMWNNDMDPT